MKGYRKVLVSLNGNKGVLDYGISLAGDEKTWLTVVKVVPQFEGDIDLTGIKKIEDSLDSGSRHIANEIESTARASGFLIKTRIEKGDISGKIVQVAEEERCDLIVMGAPKNKWFRKIWGDNAVEKVIAGASCPVLVVSG